ncbi:sensor histidine kinase [Actinoplanes derwentensis]|uniref:Anti-sigma regulatory factor (Ser/Thr protein kinase) n=1 Tax=Actinoplanes derwentensis TaxID=113562 RepID=A0A1H1VLT6_9ACTN|nr:sensor histidine kinase [Actinoplanes derwentensis]GID83658.1 anti-sigma regulatory factor [Actinoplanes derwentensis]SDS85733.1 Anti-sigma regulatory factor (Ser/Thr protein kinase) [Actinoplanes derwentensis]
MTTAVFDHPGLLYHDAGEYLRATTGFVRAAAAAGDAVLVAVPGPNLTLLREALADLADVVTFADMTVAGRNPGRIIPGVLLAFAARYAGRRVSIIGEPIWPARSDVEYPACATHEALINVVFGGFDAAILCPYDALNLTPERLHDAWRTHPEMITSGQRRPSPWFTDPLGTAATFNQPLPEVPVHASAISYADAVALKAVRRFVGSHAVEAGLSADRADDLVVAVNELAENTIRHTPAGGVVSLWREDEYLACQIDDHGTIADPLAGRIPQAPHTEGGRGLLLAHHYCDLVRIHTTPDGTSIRLHMS